MSSSPGYREGSVVANLSDRRQQQNLQALKRPQVGDTWAERKTQRAGVVLLVILRRYVLVDLQDGKEPRFWSLREYGNYYRYRSIRTATWCDVTRDASAVSSSHTALWQIARFFQQRWSRQLRTLFSRAPKSFQLAGWRFRAEWHGQVRKPK
jgi:hypothetical protein